MNRILANRLTLLLPVLIFFTLFTLVALAQENTILYPISELDNCENKSECFSYCDEPSHIPECVTFALSHNLMSQEEADTALRFADTLAEDGGPGGCTTAENCEAYCTDISNLNECLAFADEHGHTDENIEDGRKIAAYLQSGGQMPGECTSEKSCEIYCSDFAHIDECLTFAESVGFDVGHEDIPDDVNREQLRLIVDLMKKGETPGGCTSKDECEAYCLGEDKILECVEFGERVGFISAKEADIARKTGGRGPGGCSSENECREFCETPENQESCFEFARDHGIIGEFEINDIEEGRERLREGLVEAPPEALECLRNNIHDNVVEEIEKGTFVPTFETGDVARECIERAFREQSGTELEQLFDENPPEIRKCVEDKFGGSLEPIISGSAGHDEIERVMQECFAGQLQGQFEQMLADNPPEVRACILEKLGGSLDPLVSGKLERDESERLLQSCFDQFAKPLENFEFEDEDNFFDGENIKEFQPDDLEKIEPHLPPDDFIDDANIPDEYRNLYETQLQDKYEEQYQRQLEEELQNQYDQQTYEQNDERYKEQFTKEEFTNENTEFQEPKHLDETYNEIIFQNRDGNLLANVLRAVKRLLFLSD